MVGSNPGFEDVSSSNLRPAAGSSLLNLLAGASPTLPSFPFPTGLWPPTSEPSRSPLVGAPSWPRGLSGAWDIGALERPAPIFVDGSESQNSHRWSAAVP